jgi:hypothetical protein
VWIITFTPWNFSVFTLKLAQSNYCNMQNFWVRKYTPKIPMIAETFLYHADEAWCQVNLKLIFGRRNAKWAILYQQNKLAHTSISTLFIIPQDFRTSSTNDGGQLYPILGIGNFIIVIINILLSYMRYIMKCKG